jgi:sigma-B regulation protein RsbU (phosphoserine phosphatase)
VNAGPCHRSRFGRGPDRRTADIPPAQVRRHNLHDRRKGDIGWMTLFRGTDERAVAEAIADCDVIAAPAGFPLLKPGDANDSVFLLLSGQLVAHLDIALTPETGLPILPGECIGELSAIDGKPVSALVLAATDCRLLNLPQALFWGKLMFIPGVARNLLAALSTRMRRTNEIMLDTQRQRLALEHLRKELEVARQLQTGMLPLRRPMIPGRDDVEIAGIMDPASAVGGDFFDAFFVDARRLFFCIGDVSGHGVPAALFMARAIGLMRLAAMGAARPDQVLERVNDQLCQSNDTSMFVTLFCGVLDVATGALTYSNAGHLAPLLMRGGRVTRLPIPKGTLAGAISGLRYSARELVLDAGDILVCFTDGVSEAQTGAGEEFSEDRLQGIVTAHAASPLETLLDLVREAVSEFTGSRVLADDCTLLAIRRPAGKN